MNVTHADGRTALNAIVKEKREGNFNGYDIMVIDAFNSILASPFQLISREAFQMMREHEFNGIPVVDSLENKKLVGLVTDYDLISKRTAIHLPTFDKLFSDFYVTERHGPEYPDLKKSSMFTVKDVMNANPLIVNENAPIDEVAIFNRSLSHPKLQPKKNVQLEVIFVLRF